MICAEGMLSIVVNEQRELVKTKTNMRSPHNSSLKMMRALFIVWH